MKLNNIKNKKIKNIVLLCFTMIFIAVSSFSVFADSPSGFSIAALLPENQVNNEITYFDLQMEPGMEQTIQIEAENTEEVAIIVYLELHESYTSDDGTIQYLNTIEPDKSMNVRLTDIATVREKELRLEPGETKAFNIDIKMPEEQYDGVLLGGLVATSSYVEDITTEDDSAFAIENRFALIKGLILRETDTKVTPEFNLESVEAGMTNLRPDIKLNIQNAASLIVKEMKVKAEVTKKGQTEVLHSLNIEDADMAPNSSANFLIKYKDQEVVPGDYTARVVLEYEGQEWTWEEDFVIEAAAAAEINEEGIIEEAEKEAGLPMWVYIALGVGATLILFLIIVVVIMLTKKGKNERDNNRQKLKSTYTKSNE